MPEQHSRQNDGAAAAKRTTSRKALAELRRLERLFETSPWPEPRVFVRSRNRAREHALELLSGGAEQERIDAALLAAAADLIGACGRELAAAPRDTARLVGQLEQVVGLDRIELAREVLRSPERLASPPGAAVEVQLGLLMAFAPLRCASVWISEPGARVRCACHVGEGRPSRNGRDLAKKITDGTSAAPGRRQLLFGAALGGADGRPLGALIGLTRSAGRERSRVLLNEAAPMLTAFVQRDLLLARSAAAERALIEASERKLMRLSFDLHDGPIQDVAVLADDLRLFRDQLTQLIRARAERELVRGRIEDIETQLAALYAELRRVSGEVQAASVLLKRPFATALRDRVGAFAARTGIEPEVTLEGDMGLLSTSQQIALLNIIQEALSNIREHAHARSVLLSVSAAPSGIEAQVWDDGKGFEPQATLKRAGRQGRIGLLAMNERVRLLGGRCRIDSRPGGPTVVSVQLERWNPLVERSG
jgi:signal transduction histidine kinase